LKSFIIKTCATYRKKGIISDKDVLKYAKAHERFNALRNRYIALSVEISRIDATITIPPFPDLTVDESAGEASILEVAKRAGYYPIPNIVKRGWANTEGR
jgi:hypothetical protein